MGLPFVSSSSIFLPSGSLRSLRMKEKTNGLGFGEECAMGLIKDGSITQFFLFSFGKSVAGGERKCEKEIEVSIFSVITRSQALLGVFGILSLNPHILVRCVLFSYRNKEIGFQRS